MSNADTFRKAISTFAKGDLEGVLAYFDDDVEFDVQAPPGHPMAKLGKGKNELRQVFTYNATHLDDHTYEIRDIMEARDTTLSRGYETATVRNSSKKLAFPVVAEHRWKNGKIVFWREYFDTGQFFGALPD